MMLSHDRKLVTEIIKSYTSSNGCMM